MRNPPFFLLDHFDALEVSVLFWHANFKWAVESVIYINLGSSRLPGMFLLCYDSKKVTNYHNMSCVTDSTNVHYQLSTKCKTLGMFYFLAVDLRRLDFLNNTDEQPPAGQAKPIQVL